MRDWRLNYSSRFGETGETSLRGHRDDEETTLKMSKRNSNHTQESNGKKVKVTERPEDKEKFCTWYCYPN